MKNKSAFILCSFCLFLSMTACDQKKQEKKHTVTSSTVTEKRKMKQLMEVFSHK